MKAEYSLTCDNCGELFHSPDGFPKHQYCYNCLIAFKRGGKQVVDWVNANSNVDFNEEQRHLWEDDWQDFVKGLKL